MIYPYSNILSENECKEIIGYSSSQLQSLGVYSSSSENVSNDIRIAEGCFITEPSGVFGKIRSYISTITNSPINHIEPFNVIKYKIGGKYDTHYDFFGDIKEIQSLKKNGGDRKYSCIIYLNEDFKGGTTFFPNIGIEIHPKVGNLVIWANLNPKGIPRMDSLHAGMPVIEGEKWILVGWVREKPYKPNIYD